MKSNCIKCNDKTNHEVLKEEERNHVEESGWWEDRKYQIVKCKGCDTISFRKLYNDTEREYHFAEINGEIPWDIETYPKRTLASKDKYYIKNLPSSLDQIYKETVDSYYANFIILCSIGLRALIEGICKEKNITQGTVVDRNRQKRKSNKLDGKIQGLVENGFLTTHHAETLHEIRFLGNHAVHELYETPKEELDLAFEIVHQTLKNLYDLNVLAKKLKSSRNK